MLYNDQNISLKNIALTQFEMAREIPAAIELIANKPHNLDMQTRMIILKINADYTTLNQEIISL